MTDIVLRGDISLESGAPATVTWTDGATIGTTTGAAVVTDAAGTLQQYLRGLVVLLAKRALTHVSGQCTASGDNVLVAAPAAGTRIVVVAFIIQGASSTATTMLLKDGATEKWRILAQNQGDGLALVFGRGDEWRLTAATALNLNLSGANACNYSVAYFTEAV